MEHRKGQLHFRYYEQEYPQENDIVVVQIKEVVETGAYVSLLEYDDKEGMINPNEYSKRPTLKNFYKAVKLGRQEVVRV